jgi:nucleotide-binding universal stress UspA family protein
MRKILVGTDTSASADLAVGEAARLAGQSGAELLVLHVRPESSVRDAVDPKKSADPGGYLAGLERRFPAITVRSWAESGDRGGGCETAFRTSCSGTRRAR